MEKNIVVFSDGTGQDGGARLDARLSNVYKLYRACRIGPDTSIDPNDPTRSGTLSRASPIR